MTEQQRQYIKEQARIELARRDDEYFCSQYIKIVNKQGEQVNFKYNTIQQKIDDKIRELEADGKPVRIIILKARQEGVSTYTQAKILCKTVKNKNRNALVIAHREDSTTAIFNKAKYMYDCLPEAMKPIQRASNAKELIFDKPTHYQGDKEGLNSKIKVQTAGKESIGRSETYHYVHLSEFAFYEGESPKRQLSGILQAVPKTTGTIVIIESTANGFNDFKEIWDAAVAGENDFIPMFFAWHDYEEYKMSVTDQERRDIMSSLNEYEKKIVTLYNLTAEQIKWYRWTLKNDCNGDMNMMKQENPSYPEEAFLMTGTPVFDNENIIERINTLRKIYDKQPLKRGYFYFEWVNPETKDRIKDSSIKWIDNQDGYITIYEHPQKNYPYVIGGDTKGEGSDFFAGTVRNNVTGNRAAILHANLDPDTYTHQMYCLGRYYSYALIGIEINFDIYPVKELQRLGYNKQYKREVIDKITNEKQEKFGWKTDGNTRPMIIDEEITLIRDSIQQFNDIDMLNECLTFVYDENMRPDAQSGKHDDILFSDMITEAISSQQSRKVKEETKPIERKYNHTTGY
jgi:hypothetical protein